MMRDWHIMPFGPYKGKTMGVVPGKYLLELNKKLKPGPVKTYIENNKNLLTHKDRY